MLLALLLVIAGVVLAILQPWQGAAEPKPTAAATSSSGTDSSAAAGAATTEGTPPVEGDAPTGETGDLKPCTSEQVTVTAQTNQQTYAAGEQPQLSVVLSNIGAVDCAIDAGTASQVYEISSGSEVYWRSTDCQADPSNQVVTLKAGQQVPSASPLVWDRTRSSAETCEATDRPAAPAEGASYHLSVSIGGITSTQTAQFILN